MSVINKFLAATAVLASALGANLSGADLGDPAGALSIAKWVKGEPAKVTGGGDKVYVVEFWATWCPPCRASIPHLTEIQKHFRDKNVVVIGISDEKESIVTPFVEKMGSKMDYRVAIDDNRKTSGKYMEAYGINGIPHAFVVRHNQVIWQGHPMAGLDEALEEIVAGKYDIAKTKAKLAAENLYEQFQEAAANGEDTRADELGAKLVAAVKQGALPLESFDPQKARKEVRQNALSEQFRAAVFQDDQTKAAEVAGKLKELDPSIDLETLRDEAHASKLAGQYMNAVTGRGETVDLEKVGNELAGKLKGHPDFANNIAWAILTDERVTHRDVPLALRIAKQGCEDSQWKGAAVIDTYARALFDSGKKAEAVEAEEKAIAAVPAGNDAEKSTYERILKSYKAGKLPDSE